MKLEEEVASLKRISEFHKEGTSNIRCGIQFYTWSPRVGEPEAKVCSGQSIYLTKYALDSNVGKKIEIYTGFALPEELKVQWVDGSYLHSPFTLKNEVEPIPVRGINREDIPDNISPDLITFINSLG